MAPSDGQRTSLLRQQAISSQSIDSTTSDTRRSMLSDGMTAKDSVQVARLPISAPVNARQELMLRSVSEGHPRNAASSSSNSPLRRLSKSGHLRSSSGSADATTRRQSNPLKMRQRRKALPFDHLPPTPVRVDFEGVGIHSGQRNDESEPMSRSVNLFSSPAAAFSSSEAQRKASLVDVLSPSTSSTDDREPEEITSSDSLGTHSFTMSSDIDTPGPFTPATPSWKLRELTLVKKSEDSSIDPPERGSYRERYLVGLGLQSPAPPMFPDEDLDRPTKTLREVAKDVLPISSSMPRKRISPNTSAKMNVSGIPETFDAAEQTSTAAVQDIQEALPSLRSRKAEKKHSLPISEASTDTHSEASSVPSAPRVDFNAGIFRSAQQGQSDDYEGQMNTEKEPISPKASPVRKTSSAWSSAAGGQRPRSNSLHHFQANAAQISLPRLPIPDLPVLLVKSPSNEGRQMQWEHSSESDTIARTETQPSSISRMSSPSVTPIHAHYNKPIPPLPKPKLSLVPDVPTFGYTGPFSSSESVELYSPSTAVQSDTMYPEVSTGISRWSSGSESEDEKSTAKSAHRRGFKQRKSSGSASGQSTKKSSTSAGSGATSTSASSKKAGFFSTLGRRKKSTPILSAQASPVMTFSSSPASLRQDNLGEFAFPTNSPASYSVQSLSTANSRRGSNAAMPSSSLTSTFLEGPVQSGFHPSQPKPAPASSRSSENSTRILHLQQADASIRTTDSQQGHGPTSTRLHHPIEQTYASDHNHQHGLGIQIPTALGNSIRLQETSNVPRYIDTKLIEEKPARTSWRRSRLFLGKEPGEKEKRLSKGIFGLRKQPLPVNVDEREIRTRSQSGPLSLSRDLIASPTESAFSNLSSTDETPRLPYASLEDEHESYMDNEMTRSKTDTRSMDELDAGFEVLGHAITQTSSQADRVRTTTASIITKRSSGNAKRIRVEEEKARPRYTSLTDEGRLWRIEHPDLAFGGAQGLNLLYNVMKGRQAADGGDRNNAAGSAVSDSGTDDYGSSEGGAGGRESGSGSGRDASQGGSGDGDNQGDGDKQFNRKIIHASEEELIDDSSDSEDSYGGSDVEEKVPVAHSRRPRADSSSCSSDDVPLGQRIRDPDQLQRQLRQMTIKKTRGKQDATLASAVKAEVPSGELHFVLDANDLVARLLKVQLQQEKASEDHIISDSSYPASTNLSRNRSLIAPRKAPIHGQMLPVMPPQVSPAMSRLQSKGGVAAIQTSNLISTSRLQGQSSPISPSFRQTQHPLSSGTMNTDSSDVSMKTAVEAQPSSSFSQQAEEHRSAVIAEFANAIKARSRSRSFALQLAPSKDSARASPVPSRSVLLPQLNNAAIQVAPVTGKGEMPPEEDENGIHNSSLIASPRHRNASTGFKTSSSSIGDDHEDSGRSRQAPLPPSNSMVQHRVYLLNKQRCSTAEVEMNARVKDVVHSIMERGPMPSDDNHRTGGWVLYDVCADLGIERPIREYELISDIIALRSNAQNDYFVLKRTELAPYLSIKNVPNSSAALAGWVYVQDNHRKKWNKKWLELRDNCLYVAKTEKGKEENLLCSLSSFDIYLTDQSKVKTPKQYSFALRSQNSIIMFESPEADYVHYFSLSDAGASRHWITAILNARTFVLRQERSHLFRFNPVSSNIATAPVTAIGSGSKELPSRTNIKQKATTGLGDIGSSPSKAALTTINPLLTFPQTKFPKGSLMEEHFSSSRGSGVAGSNTNTTTTSEENDRKRREDIQMAERRVRREGKPLLGIISDITAARPINGSNNINNRV